ncbi:MAG TPA: SEC-C metal-binding domain-containing protein [Longimicrobium sp.]|nr:SEC-C metal-binding domain-containing protein [Longimicrobium sp.]
MSTPHRNDPCPCGSGKKYKACCRERDRGMERTLRLLGGEAPPRGEMPWMPAVRIAEVWEADVAPVHLRFRESPDAHPALAIVGAAGFIVHGDVLADRPIGPAARARAVADAVLAAGRSTGALPPRLHVRDEVLARELAPGLAAHGITVSTAEMPDLDDAIRSSLEHLSENQAAAWATTPATWAETEATPGETAQLHRVAAAFHRARPWDLAGDHEPLELHFDDGRVFMAAVMGAGGIDYGLALYSDPDDLAALYEGEGEADPHQHLQGMRGWSMSVSYERRSRLDRAMQREVAAAGWEVAAADAYPMLFGIRIPGQRITAEHVRIATRAMTAVLREIKGDEAVAGLADPAVEVVDEEDAVLPWEPLDEAHPIGAEGPGASPSAALSMIWEDFDPVAIDRLFQDEEDRVDRFAAYLEAQPLRKAARRRHVRNARVWSGYVVGVTRSAGAVTEYDLRSYLYDWFPRKEQVPRDVERALPESLHVFFEWLKGNEGIVYPWAGVVLDEFERVREERGPPPEGGFWEPEVVEWRGQLWEDLDERVMLHDTEMPGTEDGWPAAMTREVAQLSEELHRRWLIWYDEEVRAGVTNPGALWMALERRQRAWETAPHPALDGRTPRQAVLEQEANPPAAHPLLQGG